MLDDTIVSFELRNLQWRHIAADVADCHHHDVWISDWGATNDAFNQRTELIDSDLFSGEAHGAGNVDAKDDRSRSRIQFAVARFAQGDAFRVKSQLDFGLFEHFATCGIG